MTGGSPTAPGSCLKAVGELGAPLVVPSNPNGRRGRRARSPIRQGRVAMDMITVGIDVSKDRLDVAVCPSGEAFVVERDAAGLERLATRLRQIAPQIVALEATGGFETVAAAALAAAGLPIVVVNPAQFDPSPGRSDSAPRPIRSMLRSSPVSPRRLDPRPARYPTRRPGCLPISSLADGRSSR